MQNITIKHYSKVTGLSPQRVGYALRSGNLPPQVVSFEKYGQTYVLHVCDNWEEHIKPLQRYEHIKKTN